MKSFTRHYAKIVVIALACFALVIALFQHAQRERLDKQALMAQQEMSAKKSILSGDLAITDQLNKRQWLQVLQNTLQQVEQTTDDRQINQHLQQMISNHPLILGARWENEAGQNWQHTQNGFEHQFSEQTSVLARAHLRQTPYYFSLLTAADNRSIMLGGITGENPDNRLLILIDWPSVHELSQEQQVNLRLQEHPMARNMKTQSADPYSYEKRNDTGHPEIDEGLSHYRQKQIIVKFRSEPTAEMLEKMAVEISSKQVKAVGDSLSYVFESHSLSTEQLMAYFKQWDIVYAEPNFMYITNGSLNEPVFLPNDALFTDYQWNLLDIYTLDGWNMTRGSEAIKIAVIDSGTDQDHPDLLGRLIEGYNMVEEDKSPSDELGHGTHVTGIISAMVNNEEGIAGMSWYNQVMPIKVLDASGAGSAYNVARGIIWAVDNGASVINMSLGNYAQAEFLHDAVRYAYERDVVIVAASGNDNTDQPGYPAAYPEVLAVAATDATHERAVFSNYGDYVDVAAPGVHIASTYPGSQYAALSGTSMATPHVAALAGMIRSLYPNLNNEEVMDAIRLSATDLGPKGKDPYYGHGLINVPAALLYAGGKDPGVWNEQAVEDAQMLRPTLGEWLQQILRQLSGDQK